VVAGAPRGRLLANRRGRTGPYFKKKEVRKLNKLLGALPVVAALVAIVATTASAQTPPRIVPGYTSTFNNVQPPARSFDLIQGVSEFLPGESARMNSTSASPRYFTIVEGAITAIIGDKTAVYEAGKNFVVPAGIYFQPRNLGQQRARIFFSVLQPAWERGVQPAPGSAVPEKPSRILHTVRTSVSVASDSINVQQVTNNWEAGARNAPHVMNHPHLFSILDGELTNRYQDGSELRVAPGQAGVMTVAKPGIMESSGARAAPAFFTWIVSGSSPNTSAVPAPAASAPITPPRTGDAGLADGAEHRSWFLCFAQPEEFD
jgi:quercetin dioxygenase-like cupin family protein